ncbi:MAG: TlpA disulfide reductase family protein [Fuerstiella sp.]
MKFSRQMLSLLLCGSVVVGCGESKDAPVAGSDSAASTATESAATMEVASTATADTATTAPAAAPAATNLDPVLVGLTEEFEDLPGEFAEIKKAYEAKPTDPEAVAVYVNTIENLGMMQGQRGNKDVADAAFIRASQVLTKALDANVAIDADPLPAVVFYNHACVLGKTNKAAEGLAILDKAVKAGFSNVDQLKADEELESVRALPEYSAKLTEWEARFAELKKQHEEMLVKHAQEELAKGESFPFDFDLVDVDGKPLKLADLKGQVCIVDVWGTWCPPCRQEIPIFVKLQEKYRKYGFKMIGLNQERGPSAEANAATVTEFMANNSMNYPCAMISDEVMAQIPEFQGFPTTLFIDHHGKVRMKAVGFHEEAFMAAVIEALLTEKSAEAKAANTN